MTSRISPRTGKIRKRSARPRLSLSDRLGNLHLLLCANSFRRWPLKLHFFSEDVFRVWQKWTSQQSEKLRPGIDVMMNKPNDKAPATAQTENRPSRPDAVGIHALDIGYSGLKSQLEKGQAVFGSAANLKCAVCLQPIEDTHASVLLCPNEGCDAVSHMLCLSSAFLSQEKADKAALLPTSGECPKCKASVEWIDLVKDLSLRLRGEKEVRLLYKQKRGSKAATTSEIVDDAEFSDDDDPLDLILEEKAEGDRDDWPEISESSDDDTYTTVVGGPDSVPEHTRATRQMPPVAKITPERVIEDSEWDEAELLT